MPAPQWQGELLAGKTLLVWGEQGMGDLLQCCRYIPLLAARVHAQGGRVVWNSFPQMGALLARSLGSHVDDYSAGGGVETLPPFDYEIPLLSVPLVLGTLDDTLPGTVPYLQSGCRRQRVLAGTPRRRKAAQGRTGMDRQSRSPAQSVPGGGLGALSIGLLRISAARRSIRCSRAPRQTSPPRKQPACR